ncbi:MAG: SLC13 family permease [Promethearchaeota archaeon]
MILFITVMVIFSRENMDYVAYALLAALLSSIITFIIFGTTLDEFVSMIEVKPLIFILSLQIIVQIVEKHKIFQWVAVKTLHITKGNPRVFFYLICTIGTISAAIIADVTVAIIFVPLVIRATRILKIKPAPYLFGISITINIGSIITPFSSSENILISSAFNLSFAWFTSNFIIFVILALITTLILLDFTMLKKQTPPPEEQRQILLEIMDPKLVIISRKKFLLNSIYFLAIIIGFVFISDYSYLVALFGAILISLLNKTDISSSLAKIDWKIIFFFISLFLFIGTMEINGTFEFITKLLKPILTGGIFWAAILVLLLSSALSGFLANSPTALIFITILHEIFQDTVPNPILIAFLLGINLGGNILPQGAACDIMTLNIATENKVEGFTYKTLLKKGGAYALLHIFLCIVYIFFYCLVTGAL